MTKSHLFQGGTRPLFLPQPAKRRSPAHLPHRGTVGVPIDFSSDAREAARAPGRKGAVRDKERLRVRAGAPAGPPPPGAPLEQ